MINKLNIVVGLLSLSLTGCPEPKPCSEWIKYCQHEYAQCKAKEVKQMEPLCRVIHSLVLDCKAVGQLTRGDLKKCADASSGIGAKIAADTGGKEGLLMGLGLAKMCHDYCTGKETPPSSFNDFQSTVCTLSQENSECKTCPSCPN